ncbi:C3a anaphylatoxin chemotactic receptor-like [Terrapene carolina triunguis]|uniref:C3a anaphylatoxin chemotactic receptor-like n=1 Tax=Terrapene triunguis TaxID=2587831 RepID=UPI000E77C96E|nr:C3a anaphylatoxin chemotactic receptor-like [Terrapene carolina triunguis]
MEYLQVPFLMLCGMAFLAGVALNGYIPFVASSRVERMASAVWFLNRALTDFILIIFLPLRVTSFHMFSSTFFLTTIGVDRCILVTRTEWSWNHRTPPLAFIMVLGMWALSFGFSLRYGDLWESLLSPASTSMNFRADEWRVKATIAMQFLVGFLIPFALILIPTFYIVLAAKLRRNRLIQSTKPLKILLGLIPTIFLCWLPYHVVFLLLMSANYTLSLLNRGRAFAYVLTYLSSCLNPILYLTMEEEFLRYQQRACNSQTTDNLGSELVG